MKRLLKVRLVRPQYHISLAALNKHHRQRIRMQNYSPPVTRLKARALYLAAVAAKNKGPPGGEVGEGCRYSQRVTRLRNRKEESLTQRPSLPKSGEKLGNSCMRSAGRRAGMPCGPPLSSSSPLGEVNASALNSASASRSGSLAASHRAGAGAGAVIIGVDGIGDDSAALAESGPEGGGQAIRRLNGVGEGEGKGNGQVSKSHLTDQTKIISNPNPSSQDPNSKFSGHEGGCRIVHGEEQSGNLPEAVAGTGAEAEVKGLGGGTEDGRVTTSKESEERTDGKETEGTSINGKNEAPAGSARETVLGPIVKRNRRELKLSEEETAMAGAPQGPVYQVTVLSTDQFEPSPNPEQEMQAVLVAAEGRGDWADLYSALDSARRLTIFHRDVLLREEQQHLNQAVGLVGLAVGNLRSSMVRNALLCVKDMFSCLGQDMARVDVGVVVGGTLQRLAGDKRFICLAAAEALEAASRKGPSQKVLHAILPSCEDRNAEVSSKAALYVELCLTALGVGNNAGAGLPEGTQVHGLLRGM
ncbi:unnamed protein product, partial [Discosporangium mesarthrocarpum]